MKYVVLVIYLLKYFFRNYNNLLVMIIHNDIFLRTGGRRTCRHSQDSQVCYRIVITTAAVVSRLLLIQQFFVLKKITPKYKLS